MSNEKFKCCEFIPHNGKKAPSWSRTGFLSEEGVVFLPGVVAASEMEIFLCISADGVECLVSDEHIYVPVDWLAKNYPKIADHLRKAEKRIRTHFKEESRQ